MELISTLIGMYFYTSIYSNVYEYTWLPHVIILFDVALLKTTNGANYKYILKEACIYLVE